MTEEEKAGAQLFDIIDHRIWYERTRGSLNPGMLFKYRRIQAELRLKFGDIVVSNFLKSLSVNFNGKRIL